MPTLRVDRHHPEGESIEKAARIIRGGGLVAFPTETVYGLGANALDEAAVARIYEAKGRPAYNPLIAHVAGPGGARELTTHWPATATRLAEAYWPGPLTLVLPRGDGVPAVVSAGLATIAVRVPAHPVALALIRAAGVPIVGPSANPSMAVSPTRAEHVERGLGERVDLILDAGPTGVGIESTVVDLSRERPALLRPGAIAEADLARIVGPLEHAPAPDGSAARSSPGMLERHYAPRGLVEVFTPADREMATTRARDAREGGLTVGGLLRQVRDPLEPELDHTIRMPSDPAGYARELYAALHRLDEANCGLILVEAVPGGGDWAGVRDRLHRAATRPDGYQAMP